MKSLNDSLREEFAKILNELDIKEMIEYRKLDMNIIKKAFGKLLDNKSGADIHELVNKGRSEFETNIINALKTKTH